MTAPMSVHVSLYPLEKQYVPPLYAFCHCMFPFASSLSRRAPRQHSPGYVLLLQLPATREPPSGVVRMACANSVLVALPVLLRLLNPRCHCTFPPALSFTTRT